MLDFRALFWIVIMVNAYVARWFIVEYVGSVAAYISPYKDSRFYQLRDEIQQIAFNIAKVIYGIPDDTEWKYPKGGHSVPFSAPQYGKVLTVGHSLGSVLAYDTLNRLINLDNVYGGAYDVVGRTRAFGHFWFSLGQNRAHISNAGEKSAVLDTRATVASVQPLIVSYDLYRPPSFRWVNIWSRADIISGELNTMTIPMLTRPIRATWTTWWIRS